MIMKTFASLIIVCLAICCTSIGPQETLRDIESYINERPDSALEVLQSIPKERIVGRREKALYALLYSQALDKNWIDVTNDSLINIAVKYYEPRHDYYHSMLADYYAGNIAFNAGNYTLAAIYGTKASDLALKLGDNYYLGLIYRLLSYSYSYVWEHPKALFYVRKSRDAFIAAGKKEHALFAEISTARMLLSEDKFDDCLAKLDSIKNDYGLENNSIRCDYHALRAIIAAHREDDSVALAEFREWEKTNLPDHKLVLYNCVCLPFQRANKPDSVSHYRSLAEKEIITGQDSLQHFAYLSDLLFIKGEYREAYKMRQDTQHKENEHIIQLLSSTIDSSISNYWKQENETKALKVRDSRIIICFVSIISILLITLLLLYALKKKEAAKAYYSKLLSASEDIDRLSIEVETKVLAYRQFVHKRQLLINNVIHAFNASEEGSNAKEVYMEIEDLLQSMRYKREGFATIELELNSVYPELLLKLKTVYPSLSKEEYALLVYWFYGFSQETVSILTKQSMNSLYKQKSEWKSRFVKLGSPEGDLFASLMSVSRASRNQ